MFACEQGGTFYGATGLNNTLKLIKACKNTDIKAFTNTRDTDDASLCVTTFKVKDTSTLYYTSAYSGTTFANWIDWFAVGWVNLS